MISDKLQDAINNQINAELFSEFYYLSMAAYLSSEGLDGFENFFIVQAQEEHTHAMKLYHFLNERGGRVMLQKIDAPKTDFDSPVEVFKLALEHEQHVTSLINQLMDTAIEEKDHAARSFLNWFVDEQVEEEATMDTLLSKLKLINGEGQGLLMMDKELAARTFTDETA